MSKKKPVKHVDVQFKMNNKKTQCYIEIVSNKAINHQDVLDSVSEAILQFFQMEHFSQPENKGDLM